MKRMTFLTVLALVFSLFTITAALASPAGHGSGDGNRAATMTMDRTHADGSCTAETGGTDCAPVRAQTQTRTQAQDGTCEDGGAGCACESEGTECDATHEQTKAQTQTRTQAQDGTCSADNAATECSGAGDATMTQTRMRFMQQPAESCGEGSDWGYRLGDMIRMWARASGSNHIPCIL